MAKLGFANLTNLLFSFLAISNIIYNKQSFYDQLTSRNNWNAHYDYIIVGGGTSGSVLAARLTEDPEISVLLLEAGSSETVTSNTPGLSETLIGTVMDWKWLSVPQNNSCLAMNGRQCHLASGRVIGGTSSINRMYYLRGNPRDFDHWETKFGLKSWAWKDVFPYMIRNENQKDPERAKTGHYGLNGPVYIGATNKSPSDFHENKILESFLLASRQFGYRTMDLNTGVSNGSSILQSTINQGKRQSMASAFLEPNIKSRQNLHILANSVAVKILFDNERAIGVKFYRDWQQYSVFARQEVIISAGALHSPKLLLLSGIGPRNDLNRLQIPLISDLPVGENLHDHVGALGLYFVANDLPEPGITKQHLKQYFYYSKGPLAESRYAATVFRSNPNHRSTIGVKDSPDLMLLAYINGLTNREFSAELTEHQINLKRSVWNLYYGEKLKTMNGKLQFTILPIVLKPKSRGTIRLKSNNPFDMPQIDPNYLDHPDDLNQMVRAMREALRIVRTKPFEQYGIEWFRSIVPGCEYEFQKFESEIETMFDNFPIIENEDDDQLELDLEPILTTQASINQTIPTSTISTITINHQSSGLSNNLPFYFVSSFMSKLFRKSSLKKFHKVAKRQMKSSNFSSFSYDQYWLGHNVDQNKMMHPLINKTIYGSLVDGFSSSSSSNFDQSAITMWNSHSDRRHPNPSADGKISSTTIEPDSFAELPPDVSPIVLTGFFSSPPKFQHSIPSTINYNLFRPTESSLLKIKSTNNGDQYLKCMARMMTMPLGDYVGTCRMGSSNDRHRVVDERFRVIGTRNLRVIDNSVVPEITTGGLAPVAIMLGERGAEFIKEDRKQIKRQ